MSVVFHYPTTTKKSGLRLFIVVLLLCIRTISSFLITPTATTTCEVIATLTAATSCILIPPFTKKTSMATRLTTSHYYNHHRVSRSSSSPVSSFSLSSSSSSHQEGEYDNDNNKEFSIEYRKCLYGDLAAVTDIIMNSFYNKTNPMLDRLYKLGELNRLQNNFPYSDPNHEMFVAVATTSKNNNLHHEEDNNNNNNNNSKVIVGFVDIDARPCRTTPILPRPYLSDLAVHPMYRRRGIARELIKKCEDFLIQRRNDNNSKNYYNKENDDTVELYLRVQSSNGAAVAMYNGLDYDITETEPIDITNLQKGKPIHVFKKQLQH